MKEEFLFKIVLNHTSKNDIHDVEIQPYSSKPLPELPKVRDILFSLFGSLCLVNSSIPLPEYKQALKQHLAQLEKNFMKFEAHDPDSAQGKKVGHA